MIDIGEVETILREHLAQKFNCEVGGIAITSYDQVRITIDEFGMFEAVAFKHRTKP